MLSKTARSIALQALIFTKSLKQRRRCDKFLMFAGFCMRIAKPSLPITQFLLGCFAFKTNLELVSM